MLYLSLMAGYDLIIVLGSQPDTSTWQFPDQIYNCLDRAKQLLDNGQAPFVATSGKWGINVDALDLIQPFRESDAMADYLLVKGVAPEKILRERDSKDSISNLYYLKTQLLMPYGMKRLLFVVAEFRIPRLKFLCGQILGEGYECRFEPIASEAGNTYDEANTLKVQKKFLEPMEKGNHEWLADKFYTAPMYQYWTRHNQKVPQHAK